MSSDSDQAQQLARRSRHDHLHASGRVSRKENSLTKITRDRSSLSKAEDQVWELIANKMLPPEESDLMVKRLERRDDARTRRTYVNGIPRSELIDAALTLKVGLTFLPGADKAQVTRLEQNIMTDGPLDQKNALWRVNTAATLLRDLDVGTDLSVREIDRTAEIAARARQWRRKPVGRDDPNSPGAKPSPGMNVVMRRSEDVDAVTIDSEHVRIVSDLRSAPRWDIEATLIEVDGSSLLGLITHYQFIIARGGPEMDFEETRNLLDIMIEDARRLCVRSPILFRMSTRNQIIKSRNTRYGIDHAGRTFRTITTSKGIKEIIRLGVAYFDSLDPAGGGDLNQQLIRPRFLQMLALLLMFLNDEDLNDIQDLLQSTYGIRSTRPDIELLLLKVVPFSSINPRVFLEALIPAVDQPLGVKADDPNQSYLWDIFVAQILRMGYILPVGLDLLGRATNSWIAKWPDGGFKSTTIFNHLQYNGDRYRAVNDMTAVDLHPEDSFKELTVQLADGIDYYIESNAIVGITRMNTGIFSVQKAAGGSSWGDRQLELEIEETQVNEELERAILRANNILDQMNTLLPSRTKRLFGKHKYHLLKNFEGTGRITKHTAILHQEVMAIRYKIEGRKVKKRDAWRIIGQTSREFRVLLMELKDRAQKLFVDRSDEFVMEFSELERLHQIVKQRLVQIEVEEDYPDEPIQQLLFPDVSTVRGSKALWFDYEAWLDNHSRTLQLNAQLSRVVSCRWLPNNVVDVHLEGHTQTYTAEVLIFPGEPDTVDHEEDIMKDDHAALVGNYMVVAVEPEDDRAGFIMTNYLKIVGTENAGKSRRGANRAIKATQRELMTLL